MKIYIYIYCIAEWIWAIAQLYCEIFFFCVARLVLYCNRGGLAARRLENFFCIAKLVLYCNRGGLVARRLEKLYCNTIIVLQAREG